MFCLTQKSVDPEVKASVPEVRSEPEEEPSKPIPVGELIMSESKNMEKQVEKMEEPVVVPAENKEIPTVQ